MQSVRLHTRIYEHIPESMYVNNWWKFAIKFSVCKLSHQCSTADPPSSFSCCNFSNTNSHGSCGIITLSPVNRACKIQWFQREITNIIFHIYLHYDWILMLQQVFPKSGVIAVQSDQRFHGQPTSKVPSFELQGFRLPWKHGLRHVRYFLREGQSTNIFT